MRNFTFIASQQRLTNNILGKIANIYLIIILFTIFTSLVSISIGNFVHNKLMINIRYSETGSIESTTPEISNNLFKVKVRKNENFQKILAKQKISTNEINQILDTLKSAKINFNLVPGQLIVFDYDIIANDEEELNHYTLKNITISYGKTRKIVINKDLDYFTAKEILTPLKKVFVKHEVKIKGNLTETMKKVGLSIANIQELINAYSHQIDLQREVRTGDSVSLITEKFYTEEGEFTHNGKVLFASLNLNNSKQYKVYWFRNDKKSAGQYYSENGVSAKRSLLRTPINTVRISSHFGHRQHPISGYSKMHKGVDFAAPIGTPILAAGNGIITELGSKGAYGKYIQIKHSPNLSTAYAHISKITKGIKIGSRVLQGQVIAESGNSGRSTGPHLHYEVRINGKHVNPLSIHTTPGQELAGIKLHEFKKYKAKIHNSLAQKVKNDNALLLTDLTL